MTKKCTALTLSLGPHLRQAASAEPRQVPYTPPPRTYLATLAAHASGTGTLTTSTTTQRLYPQGTHTLTPFPLPLALGQGGSASPEDFQKQLKCTLHKRPKNIGQGSSSSTCPEEDHWEALLQPTKRVLGCNLHPPKRCRSVFKRGQIRTLSLSSLRLSLRGAPA